ncbi:sigma-70 family RNA polymerase sigma factor [Amycolatopsis sp. NPDC051061]|uniref:sigma-70 family RNA polymerase sigma factor n=1 Tax=Amycolatopsis sp. NPDC051061 TaxID=3155042 RepID=UPI0034228DB9
MNRAWGHPAYPSSGPGKDVSSGSTNTDIVGDLDSRIELVEDYNSVSPLLKQLPNDERTILQMRFFDGLSQSQIASRIGVSQMQASRLLTRILEKLCEKLVE